MPSAVQGFTPTQTGSAGTTRGFNDMTGNDFMKVMIAQLQQQDPLDPAKSDQLLTQMSQIRQLESSTALTQNLQGLSLQQSIGSGGNLIGKTINGLNDAGNQVSGVVTAVQVLDKQVYLQLDTGDALPLTSVTQIAQTPGGADATGKLASSQPAAMQTLLATPQIQSLLSQLGLNGSQLSAQQLASIINSPQGQQILTTANSGSQSSTGNSGGGLISGLLGLLGV